MANKTTVALTLEQFREIIDTMRSGGAGFRPNNRIAACLILEANLGLRIEDILQLHLSDFIKDGSNYRINITEQKTQKNGYSLSHWPSISLSSCTVAKTALGRQTSFSRSPRGPSRSICRKLRIIWGMKTLGRIPSENSLLQIFTNPTAAISNWFENFCSTAPR